jgi:hypothetical protein
MKSIQPYLTPDNVLNIYQFGSLVYRSHNENSDQDFIFIVKEFFESPDVNLHVYTVEQFQLLLDRHDIQALECIHAPSQFILKEKQKFSYELNKAKLRVAISTVTSNSWIKGKKKLTVAADYDLNLAIKSIFHSLRILDFGIQIANTGTIQDYSSMNWLLLELRKLSEQYKREELWCKIEEKYKKLYNSKSSEFKMLAPKDLSEKDNKLKLVNTLKSHKIAYTDELINEILAIF